MTKACKGYVNAAILAAMMALSSTAYSAQIYKGWSTTGLGSFDAFSSTEPVISDLIYVSKGKSGMLLLDSMTGKKKDTIGIKETVIAGPAVDGKLIYVGTKSGKLLAFDTKTNKVVWEEQLNNVLTQSPLVTPRNVIVQTIDGKLMAFDKESKKLVWLYERSMPTLALKGGSKAVLHKGMVISGFANGRLVALDEGTGDIVWERGVSEPSGHSEIKRLNDIVANPIVDKDIVYAVTYQGKLVALNLYDGNLIWSKELSAFQNMDCDDNALYVTNTDNEVSSIDKVTGNTLWVKKGFKHDLTGPSSLDTTIAVGDKKGTLFYLSKKDGAILAQKTIRGGAFVNNPVSLTKEGSSHVLNKALTNGVLTAQQDGKIGTYYLQGV